jgi:hypothetical protein
MPAIYPGGAAVFTTKNDGDVIAAAHMNAVQDEIAAIEASLIVGGSLPSPQRIASSGSVKPTLILDAGAGRLGRVQATGLSVLLSQNVSNDGASWNLDDTANAGSILALNPATGFITMYYVAAGANPRPLVQIYSVDSVGNVTIPGGAAVTGTVSANAGYYERSRATLLGNWVAFTPVWGATGVAPVLGNGSIQGQYTEIGNTVLFNIYLTIGSTSTFGTGNWTLTFPPKLPTGNPGNANSLTARVTDASTGLNYAAIGSNVGGGAFYILAGNGAAAVGGGGTVPIPWAVNDLLTVAGFYSE